MISENLERVRERIAAAARSAGRDPAQVRLICVTKGVSVERIQEAVAAGVSEIGENRVQEAQQKQAAFRYDVPNVGSVRRTDLRWHLIGRLQRNKAKLAAEIFDCIHSVDSMELVEALDRQLMLRQAQHERRLEILIQVNVSGEATKGGCRPEQAGVLAEALLRTKRLEWAGLMTMAPYSENPEEARPFFRRLRELRDSLEERYRDCFVGPDGPLRNDGKHGLDLSMGMSGDFEMAVQEGATMVRIGTAIFGEKR